MADLQAAGATQLLNIESKTSKTLVQLVKLIADSGLTKVGGLNVLQRPPSPRLKAMPPGGMCQCATRLLSPAEIDAELMGWVGAVYRAAG